MKGLLYWQTILSAWIWIFNTTVSDYKFLPFTKHLFSIQDGTVFYIFQDERLKQLRRDTHRSMLF